MTEKKPVPEEPSGDEAPSPSIDPEGMAKDLLERVREVKEQSKEKEE